MDITKYMFIHRHHCTYIKRSTSVMNLRITPLQNETVSENSQEIGNFMFILVKGKFRSPIAPAEFVLLVM